MAAPQDLTGQRFGKLIALRFARHQGKKRVWECRCDCGNLSYAFVADLKNGKHKSCGCLQKAAVTKHGHTHFGTPPSPTYRSWTSMVQRCMNPKAPMWSYYGGRGITICEKWLSFENFLADMGERPSLKHTIERLNNDIGHYEPTNCIWATRKEQAQNRRKPVRQYIPPRHPTTGRFTTS